MLRAKHVLQALTRASRMPNHMGLSYVAVSQQMGGNSVFHSSPLRLQLGPGSGIRTLAALDSVPSITRSATSLQAPFQSPWTSNHLSTGPGNVKKEKKVAKTEDGLEIEKSGLGKLLKKPIAHTWEQHMRTLYDVAWVEGYDVFRRLKLLVIDWEYAYELTGKKAIGRAQPDHCTRLFMEGAKWDAWMLIPLFILQALPFSAALIPVYAVKFPQYLPSEFKDKFLPPLYEDPDYLVQGLKDANSVMKDILALPMFETEPPRNRHISWLLTEEHRTEDGVTRRVIREKPKMDHLVGRGLVPFFVEGTDDVNEDLTNVHSASAQGDMGAVEARTWNPDGYWEDARLVGTGGAANTDGQVPYVDDAGNNNTPASRKTKSKGSKGKKISPRNSKASDDMQRITDMLTRSAQKQQRPSSNNKSKGKGGNQQVATPTQPAGPTYASITKSTPKKQAPSGAQQGKGKGKSKGKGNGNGNGNGNTFPQANIVSVPSRAAANTMNGAALHVQAAPTPVYPPHPMPAVMMPHAQPTPQVLQPQQQYYPNPMMPQQAMHMHMHQHQQPFVQPQQQGYHQPVPQVYPSHPLPAAPTAPATAPLLTPALLTPADIYNAAPVLDNTTTAPPQQAPRPSKQRRPSAEVDSSSRFAGNAFQAAPAPDALPIPEFGDSAPAQPAQPAQPQRDTAAMTRDLRSMLGVV